jgi:cytochrome c-type biogenesis protein
MEVIAYSFQQRKVFFHAVFFVLGFSLVFIIGWGGAATLLGQTFGFYKGILGKIGGAVVILFGLTTMGVLKIPWLFYDTRPEWKNNSRRGLLASGLMGIFFAAGWTPCIGTTLGAILTLGFSQETRGQAILLSSGYAIGLGMPFLLLGLSIERAGRLVKRILPYLRILQIGSGVFLILIGVMILTNQITAIAIWAQRNNLFLDLSASSVSSPSYLIAVLAGLISFISPCVLPLVPAYLGYLSGHVFGGADSSVFK